MIKIFREVINVSKIKKNSAPTVNTGGHAPKIHMNTPNKSDAQGIEAKFCSPKLTKTEHTRRKTHVPQTKHEITLRQNTTINNAKEPQNGNPLKGIFPP